MNARPSEPTPFQPRQGSCKVWDKLETIFYLLLLSKLGVRRISREGAILTQATPPPKEKDATSKNQPLLKEVLCLSEV